MADCLLPCKGPSPVPKIKSKDMKKFAAILIVILSFSARTGLFSQTTAQTVTEGTTAVHLKMTSNLVVADSMANALLENYKQDMSSNDSVKAQITFMMGTLEHSFVSRGDNSTWGGAK